MIDGPHPVYSQDATVYLTTGVTRFDALQAAIDQSGFLEHVESAFQQSGKSDRAAFAIAIKPNIGTASIPEDGSPVYTDPQLVGALCNRLRAPGFEDVAVVEARNVYDYT